MNVQDARIQGEWKVEDDEQGNCWVRIPGGHDWCFGDIETTDTCCFAVAYLAAAAPELYDALKQIAAIPFYAYGDNEAACRMVDIARAAIKKAEEPKIEVAA